MFFLQQKLSENTLDTWGHAELQMLHTYHMQSLQTLSDQPSFLNPTTSHQGIYLINLEYFLIKYYFSSVKLYVIQVIQIFLVNIYKI